MGKKGDKEAEALKKQRKAAAQSSKAAKSSKKAQKKGGDDEAPEEDIEAILARLQVADAKKVAVAVTPCERPSARANCSLTPLPSGELLLFGGEFFDGQTNMCYNDVFRCSSRGGDWRMVSSPTSPPHRCSHQAILFPPATVVVFGGEFATANQFYHYSDTWRLDLPSNKWTRVESKKGPSARSGHRLAVWRNYVVLFGGFHQSLTQDKWFSDLWLLDTRTWQWSEVTFPGTAMTPSARSGHQLLAVPGADALLLYGGYSEIKATTADRSVVAGGGGGGKGKGAAAPGVSLAMMSRKSRSVVHTDMWMLKMLPVASGGLPAWDRVRCVGATPSPRLAFSMAMYKDRALLFGGVADSDADEKGEIVVSTFFHDLYSYDVGRKRWYNLELRDPGAAAKKGGGAGAGGKRAAARARSLAAASAAAADEELDDDAVSLGSEAEEEEAEEGSGAGVGGLDDGAFYFVGEDGKLVRIADDEGAGGEEAEAHDGAVLLLVGGAGGGNEPVPKAVLLAPPAADQSSAAPPPAAADASLEGAASPSSPVAPKRPALASSPVALRAAAPAATPSSSSSSSHPPPAAVAPAPAGRMKAAMWVEGHKLLIFGGMFEGKQRETTLDDLWSLDLREKNGWQEVQPARLHVWKGDASDDDDDDEEGDSEGEGDGSDGGDDASSDSSADEGAEEEDAGGGRGIQQPRHGGRRGTKEGARLKQLRDQLGVEDAATTPAPGETVRDFFVRTGDAWVRAYVSTKLTAGDRIDGKQLRKKAFEVARARYDQVWPLLQELFELEEQQRQLEASAGKSHRRGGGVSGAAGGGGGGKR